MGCDGGVKGLAAEKRQVPTAMKAQLPSGKWMIREANAGGRKETGNRDKWLAPPPVVPHN